MWSTVTIVQKHQVALTFDSMVQILPLFKATKPLLGVICDLKRKKTNLTVVPLLWQRLTRNNYF